MPNTDRKNNLKQNITSYLNTQANWRSNRGDVLFLKKRLKDNTYEVSSYDEFKELIENQNGFISTGWDGDDNTEEAIKKETKATIRCILKNIEEKDVKCIYSGKPAKHKVIFAKSY